MISGYSKNGLPYACIGRGQAKLAVFEGLDFNHKPPSRMRLRMSTGYLNKLTDRYTIYIISRKPRLPAGYPFSNMADDYAVMIKNELGGKVDIIGVSTGGAIAQYLAINHPALVRRLVLVMAGCRLHPEAKELQMRVAHLTKQGKWRSANKLLGSTLSQRGIMKYFLPWFMWLMGPLSGVDNPSDGIVEIEAEDSHDLSDELTSITVDTLVIGGEEDFFYPLRETAQKIPNTKLILYPGLGHNAMFVRSRQFGEEIQNFLLAD